MVGMAHAQVDAKARDADLGLHLPALCGQGIADRLLERGLGGAGRAAVLCGQRHRPAFGKVQEGLEIGHAPRAGAAQVDLVGAEGGEDMQFRPGARHRHVQPPLAPVLVHRAEVHGELAGLVGAEGDGKQHHVAFVALDVFQVLDDHGLLALVGEEPFQGRVGLALGVQQVKDQPLLLGVEGDDAQRRARRFGQGQPARQAVADEGRDGAGLVGVGRTLAALIGAGDPVQPHRVARAAGRGEGDKPPIIVEVVGKGDQRFVPAAIVPVQAVGRDARRRRLVQDRGHVPFMVGQGRTLLDALVAAPEEVRGRQLPGVAHDDRLPAAGDGADGIPGRDLRGLVKDDQVELRLARG